MRSILRATDSKSTVAVAGTIITTRPIYNYRPTTYTNTSTNTAINTSDVQRFFDARGQTPISEKNVT